MSALTNNKQLEPILKRVNQDMEILELIDKNNLNRNTFETVCSRYITAEDYFQYGVNELRYSAITYEVLDEIRKPDLEDIVVHLAQERIYEIFKEKFMK